ncbi:MAG: DUF58 domain-containing protein [Bacillota bacterium]
MLAEEIIKKVRSLQIHARRLVTDIPSGQYSSAFRGSGMEFDEVREYQPGDDVRAIDWNVSARMGSPYIKRFVEERELTVMLVVDLSLSQSFGSFSSQKSDVATELSAVLAFLATSHNDKVGLIAFSDQVNLFVPPDKSRKHVLRIIREILCSQPTGKGTDLKGALDYLNKVMRRSTVTFLISDFCAPDFSTALRLASRRHDIVALRVIDPWELELPPVGLLELEDPETGRHVLVDTSSRQVREHYARLAADHQSSLSSLFQSCDIDYADIFTDRPYIVPLRALLSRREHRRRLRP